MAVGFTQTAERTYTIKVQASYFDYIWSDERIQEAKERLDQAFCEFERSIRGIGRPIDSIEIVGVQQGPSKTI